MFVFSVCDALPSNQLSNIPWRQLGIKYRSNEAYFDLIEEIDAIIDRNGVTVMCEIQGYVSPTRDFFNNNNIIILHEGTRRLSFEVGSRALDAIVDYNTNC